MDPGLGVGFWQTDERSGGQGCCLFAVKQSKRRRGRGRSAVHAEPGQDARGGSSRRTERARPPPTYRVIYDPPRGARWLIEDIEANAITTTTEHYVLRVDALVVGRLGRSWRWARVNGVPPLCPKRSMADRPELLATV